MRSNNETCTNLGMKKKWNFLIQYTRNECRRKEKYSAKTFSNCTQIINRTVWNNRGPDVIEYTSSLGLMEGFGIENR